jgi:hypothetical protein
MAMGLFPVTIELRKPQLTLLFLRDRQHMIADGRRIYSCG